MKELIEKIDKVIYDTIFDYMRDSINSWDCICELRKRTKELIQSHQKEIDRPNECNCFWWLKRKFMLIVDEKTSLDCVFVTDKIDHDGRWTIFDLDMVGNYRPKYVDEIEGKWIKAIQPEVTK